MALPFDIIRLTPLFALSSNLWEELSDAAGLVIALLFILAGGLVGVFVSVRRDRLQARPCKGDSRHGNERYAERDGKPHAQEGFDKSPRLL